MNRLLDQSVQNEWVVYAKPPFGGPRQVLKYLARYTHRVAISNGRLLALQDGTVTFRWKDYAGGNKPAVMSLPALEFIRRFLMHVLPPSFVRIRYYGFMANRRRAENIRRCRELLAHQDPAIEAHQTAQRPPEQAPESMTFGCCPRCGQGHMQIVEQIARQPRQRVRPAAHGDTDHPDTS